MKKGLGRGLGALIGDLNNDIKENSIDIEKIKNIQTVNNKNVPRGTLDKIENNDFKYNVVDIDINKIKPDKSQPRKFFDSDSLLELQKSIKIHGVITPIIVVKKENDFMIIAGERRYRACCMLGLEKIPAIVKNYSKKEISEIALIENLQREDLNPIDTANAIKDLMQLYDYTQEEVADRIGKSRPHVTNMLRLLNLTPKVVELIANKHLSQGHAKCLITINDENLQYTLALTAINNNLSVREFEKLINKKLKPVEKNIINKKIDDDINNILKKINSNFNNNLSIIGSNKKGKLVFNYKNENDLYNILNKLKNIN